MYKRQELDPELFNEINPKIPHIGNINPSGKHLTESFWFAGGIPRVQRMLADYLDLDVMTVTGKTLGENLEELEKNSFFEIGEGYLDVYKRQHKYLSSFIKQTRAIDLRP